MKKSQPRNDAGKFLASTIPDVHESAAAFGDDYFEFIDDNDTLVLETKKTKKPA